MTTVPAPRDDGDAAPLSTGAEQNGRDGAAVPATQPPPAGARAAGGGDDPRPRAPFVAGVLREAEPGERRVAMVPESVARLTTLGLEVLVECGAGVGACFTDAAYAAAGALPTTRDEVLRRADLLLCIGLPGSDTLTALRAGQVLVGLLSPLTRPETMAELAARGVTTVSLDGLPRALSRAQAMDALTSQANVAGYKAVVVAADAYPRYFPLLMTAAGTARPAEVLVLGAGVAGLAAIGTAHRLGAVVRAYDVRPAARGEVESLGATFLDLGGPDGVGQGGYARELTAEEQAAQREALAAAVGRHDIVITTAQVPGRRPPLLVTQDALAAMRPGSVVVDLASGPLGGNVELSAPGTTVVTSSGVTVIGAGNLPSTVPSAASSAYARNVAALLAHLVRDGALTVALDDEITAGVVITHGGSVVHPATAGLLRVATSPPGPRAGVSRDAVDGDGAGRAREAERVS